MLLYLYLYNLGLCLHHMFKNFQNLFGFFYVYLNNTPVCEHFLERLRLWLKIEQLNFVRVF